MGENRFKKLDPALTEEAMQQEEQTTFEQNNPEDSAAFLFKMYSPKYRELIKTMPRNALMRLAVALVEGALSETTYKPTTDQESAAYVIGDKLLQARWVMQLHTLSKVAGEVEAARVAQPAPEGSIPLSDLLKKDLEPDTMSVSTNLNEGESNG